MKKPTLWTRNYKLLFCASTLGAIGGIASRYALSFLVYDETGSTLAAALMIAIQVLPQFVLTILIAPIMDRLPRKPFLVFGDLISGIMFLFAGLYLNICDFTYIGYLIFSLILACINAMDSLAYVSIYPSLITEGFAQKGYAVSGMLYPVLNVLVMPLAAIAMDTIGVGNILLIQSCLSILAALTENCIKMDEKSRIDEKNCGFALWKKDFADGFRYLKGERGLRGIFSYMAVSNGVAIGNSPIMVSFFRTAPGFTAMMYSMFTAFEFIGRTIGGIVHYRFGIKKEKRFRFAFMVYQIYDFMDAILLWLPYPAMLANRALCGFLGINSATMREASVQTYIPEEYRSRVNSVQDAFISAAGSIMALVIGAAGDLFDQRIVMTGAAVLCICVCWLTIWRNRTDIDKIYRY